MPQNRARKHNPNWKGGRYKTTDGYWKILKPNCLNTDKWGYILEHRFVMAEHLERPLLPKEIVHHLNGVKVDNRLENLAIMSRKHNSFTLVIPFRQRIRDLEHQLDELGIAYDGLSKTIATAKF